MLTLTANRFAQVSLATYGREGAFAISVHCEDEIEMVAHAFEKLGCMVEKEPLRLRLTVIPPDHHEN